MKRNIFAVCDLEVDYALNFMDYMNRKKNIPFEIQAFTSVENLIAYGKQTHIELLLISGKSGIWISGRSSFCRKGYTLRNLTSIQVCINISLLLMFSGK